MAALLWAMVLSLFLQGCLCSVGETNQGCRLWTPQGQDVCCNACHAGHRLFRKCGPNPKDLCVRCESGTFTVNPLNYRCSRCTQCVGAQVHMQDCTATSDTKCGCKEGLVCGDDSCSYCVTKCDKGYEPTKNGSCRACPEGTFSDQSHQMCKPWSTKCPNPNEHIVAKGNAFTDIQCSVSRKSTTTPAPEQQGWEVGLTVITIVALTIFCFIVIGIVAKKIIKKRPKEEEEEEKPVTKTLIIRTPTDDPQTLRAIECSFHEAQQEQGSSSESLASKDSSDQLIV
ncbi:tumor necrosis factor receptor superfamily member 9a isoform X1 [Epinephelus moara]|uniref:tumor necrosis factor receptor superfamily member 9a isoform X1 n=1 Tax=Epinephelus moara TaxID=300413 RepID=UPI00214E1E32|nr:tumor necrosis factor receptor superfamily member 9a isoform X1 [Epinephelus moara]